MYRALIVCNHLYEARDPKLPLLRGPEADGEMLGSALVDPSTGLFASAHVKVLFNASSLEIQEAASAFFGLAHPGDKLLFYFSGHGLKKNGKLYLCANNTRSDHLPATAVSNGTLNDIIDDSKADAKILILDCCYSGAFKGDEETELLLWGEGRYVLMATSAVDVAPDAIEAGQPSPFTKALVEGLLYGAVDTAGKGHVDLRDVYRYLLESLGSTYRPRQKFDGIGEFAIARRPATRAAPPAAALEVAAPETSREPYLDQTTGETDLSHQRVAEFRRQLRPDIAEQMPELLSPREFLQRTHLMREGRLTRGGALIFGERPALAVPTAVVQCTWFDGTERDALLKEKFDLMGSVPEQILGAYEFVAKVAKRGEAPTADSVIAQPVYGYPMLAVREVIANALVHRDYEDRQSCVHIRVFTDRIEVTNPGRWTGKNVPEGKTTQFQYLRSDSRRTNFTLAKVMSWMRMVEGEGAGIPRAIRDCRNSSAPEPTMVHLNGVVTVTIYPRNDPPPSAIDPVLRGGDGGREMFDLGAKVVQAWSEFARALQEVLPSLPAGSDLELTLEPTATGTGSAVYGVRVRKGEDAITALAVGNASLPEGYRLARSSIADLVALGWAPPGMLPGSGDSFSLVSENTATIATVVTRTLRDVYGAPHPAFLAYTTFDSQGEELAIARLGSAQQLSTMDSAFHSTEPDSPAELELTKRVRVVIAAMTKSHPNELPIDGDGDIGIRAGAAMVFVRVHDTPLLVDVFSPVLTDVEPNELLFVKLSQLTNRMPIGRLYFTSGTVWASVPIIGHDFQATHLTMAIQIMTGLCDELEDHLHGEFGGRRFFAEGDKPAGRSPDDDLRTGMYL